MADVNRSEPLFDQIYDVLWERILQGEITHGTRMSDLDWSRKLNVSRTPVREAMRRLQQDGILVHRDRGGSEIRRMTGDDLLNLYRCRAALEGLATREAVTELSEAAIDRLAAAIEATQAAIEAADFNRAFELNTSFHEQITGACRNPFLERFLGDLRRLIMFARTCLMIEASHQRVQANYQEHLARVQEHHLSILAAIQARDPDLAASRMQEHLFTTGNDMVSLVQMLDVN